MKLEKIKLSGFKSFVDPTTIPIKGNLISIVGPNGCGKSNIIDAVRWVMGESSAKHLRGGSMTDVIFNGSSGRKPVSTASVELVFDNSEGKAGGEYAQYTTIAIKRQVSRDGQSSYQFNGTKCRRKDITDLFLGTGLGARSYAIIEQGTISRVVEAKPDELRLHIEEAAGVSKYKERRSETEMRMRHTRENLERLDDVRDEVEKQLNHLKKQAEKAEKYTNLKAQERELKLQLLAMRWNTHHVMAQQLDSQLQDAARAHNELFMERKNLEQTLEQRRAQYKTEQQNLDQQQAEYYALLTEVSRLDQVIKHNEQSYEETERELVRLRDQADHLKGNLDEDLLQLDELKESLFESEESLFIAQERAEAMLEVQQAAQSQRLVWQQEWEAYQNQYANYREQAEVKRMLVAQLENQSFQLQSRLQRLQGEQEDLNEQGLHLEMDSLDQAINLIEEQRDQIQINLAAVHLSIKDLRHQIKQFHETLHTDRSELQSVKGKVTSLELLQQHAMGKDNQKLTHWLDRLALAENQRLAEFIEVDTGWESAVETVLGTYLEAVCIDNADQLINELATLSNESVTLFETEHKYNEELSKGLPRLLDKITTPWNLQGLLSGIYCADNTEQARQLATELKSYESIITPQGAWMGYGWVKIVREHDGKSGVLQREKQLRLLKEEQIALQARVVVIEEQLETAEDFLKEAEKQREALQNKDKQVSNELSLKNAAFSAHSARVEQQQQRLAQVSNELADIHRELLENAETKAEARMIKEQAEEAMAALIERKLQLEQDSHSLQTQSEQSDRQVNEIRQQVHGLQAKISSLKASDALTTKQIERLQLQQQQSQERIGELDKKLHQTLQPMDDERYDLEMLQQKKDELEKILTQVREQQAILETDIAELAEQFSSVQQHIDKKKELLDRIRFEQQESQVRQQTVTEQLQELEADAKTIMQDIPEHADESSWKIKVDDLIRQIERLGTINLTAIEEFKAQSERMNFLNEQNTDLLEALQILESAIVKIDNESRQRFKETFDKINVGLQEKFPKLFGGGKAYLSLTDDDLLESGVNIIAQPPGKRNSSIHLLSGGEKALTAVALVFSIFDLNPAPFCLLDEVDAPLDEANVRRFSAMVEEMSANVQFLYISHNKVTMEIAGQLAGVTMKEPGVSRMVAVDIQEAVAMAES
ncbi:MAG: chromosome segregation protein SMC [Methylococcaceae bacterium]|nr:chromosome segregation protein SMC [Methylococcaceae bacterium]